MHTIVIHSNVTHLWRVENCCVNQIMFCSIRVCILTYTDQQWMSDSWALGDGRDSWVSDDASY